MLIGVLLLIVGCQEKVQNSNASDGNDNSAVEVNFPVTITDATGTEITIEQTPEEIISLIPSNTEIAYALGLGERIIAVTENDTYPEDVQNKDIIGGFQLNFEKIISLNPDLVLAHGLNGDIDQLKNAGLTVVVVNNFEATFEDVFTSIALVAKATGTEGAGERLIKDMEDRLQAVKDQAKEIESKKSVWVEIDPTLYTTGQGTFLNEMLTLINATNIAGNEQGWPQFSEEQVINSNPEVIIATYTDAVNTITNRAAWTNIAAVKNKHTYGVNADLYSRAGPRLVEGVEKLAALIYPEKFSE
jgi:iron complex transport system substrate-binding protein